MVLHHQRQCGIMVEGRVVIGLFVVSEQVHICCGRVRVGGFKMDLQERVHGDNGGGGD